MKNIYYLLIVGIAVSLAGTSEAARGRYEEVVKRLNELQTQYAEIAQVFSMGTNDDGTEIRAIRISTTPQVVDHNKVAHLVVSTHHGNELKAPVFTMKFVEDLLARYSSDELWRGNLADIEWHIVPVLNISGYNANNRYEKGVDPNRDYPTPCPHSSSPGRLKSIRELMAYMTSRSFVGTVTVHGYVGSLTFPWGMFVENDHTHDHNQYEQITRKAAELNNYQYGPHTIIYPANGTYEDYAYVKHGMWTLLLELESGSDSDINRTVPAIAKFFEQLDSSPSVNHDFNTACTHQDQRLVDLRIE